MNALIRQIGSVLLFGTSSFVLVIVLFGSESTIGHTDPSVVNRSPVLLDVWLVPGSISAAVALISLVYSIKKDRIAKREKEKADLAQARAHTAEARVETLTKALFRAKSVSWNIEVEDLEGTLSTICAWENIEIIPKDVTLPSFDGEFEFDPPDCTITKYPTCKKSSIEGAAKGREVTLTVSEPKAPKSFHYFLHISGSFPYGSKLSYEYEFCASKGIFMNKEDIEQHARVFKHEFWGHYVATPVESVKIAVRFPEAYPIEAFYVVYRGKTFLPNNEVETAIKEIDDSGGFKTGSRWAELTVAKPYYGCSYLIYWNPPAKGIVDALKQSRVA